MKPQRGDIILFPVDGRSGIGSKIVAIAELLLMHRSIGFEQYSHAAILDKDGYIWEATWPRIGRYKLSKDRSYEVWRVKGVTKGQRQCIISWFQCHEGDWYDLLSLVTFGHWNLPHAEVCSAAVGAALRLAGIKIDPEGKHLVSPDAIADCKKLHKIYSYKGKK